MKQLHQCLLEETYSHYWKPITAVADSLGPAFEGCSKQVFHYEALCDDTPKLSEISKVDYIALKKKGNSVCVSLLEFKGGETAEKWDQEALVFKAVDTILCGFQQFAGFNRSDWGALFCNQNLVLDYYIVISDNHIMSTQEKGEAVVKDRLQQQEGKEQRRQLTSKLKRYGNKRPFDGIEIINVSNFLKRVGRIANERSTG
jgi:hypothetical protein